MQRNGADICSDILPRIGEVILCCQDMVISTAIRSLILATFPVSDIRQVSVVHDDMMTQCHPPLRLIIGVVSSPHCVRRVVKQLIWFKHHYPEVPIVYLHDLSDLVFHPPVGVFITNIMSSLEDIIAVFHLALATPIVKKAAYRNYNLTRRQKQVLRLIGRKKRNSEIAKELGIHEKTVSSYRESIRERLGLTRQQERLFIGEFSSLMESGSDLLLWTARELWPKYREES